jgi:PAS domain S-box-containing protein
MTEASRNPELLDCCANRTRAYDALATSETHYRRLFESARDGILILDVDTGKIVDVNPYLTELTGYLREDFLKRHLWEIGPFKDIASSKESFAELQEKEYVRYEDLPLTTYDGRSVSVEFVSNVYTVDHQKVIQCNVRDISERKRTEDKLRKSEKKLADILAKMRDVVWSLSWPDLSVLFISDSAERVFGRPARDFHAHPALWQEVVHPEDAHTVELSFKDLQKLGAAERTCRIVRPDGSIAWIHDRSWMVLDELGQPIRVDGIVTDITERMRAETERARLEKQLWASQRMDAIGSLAGGVAHDFNNLLSVILSYAGFAMDAVPEGDPLRNDLLEIKNAGERAASLTRQLLAFGRKQVLQPVPLSLNVIATGVEKLLRRVLGEDIDLVQALAADLGLTLADPSQLEQVLMNLVVNARDAMPEGGKLTIETSNVEVDEEYATRHVAVKPGPYVQLAVTDTGCGMDEQTRARIFEPFFTTKEKGKGTGLGLSTVYGIVKQSGGNIWVYSELGRGTTFKVYLPRELSVTAPAVIRPSAVPMRITGTETILVVEDEEALLRISLRTLEAAGYRVLTATNGDEALLVSARHVGDIHLLLTDVVMPRMGGRALAQALSKVRPALKVLYMSGYTDDAIVHHGVLDAGTHFLAKPFTTVDMTRKVREILDGGLTNHANEHTPAANNDAEVKPEQPLDEVALRRLPRDLLSKAYRAVTAARYDELVELTETIRVTEPEVAAGIRRMAGVFDYDGLRNLLVRWKE